MRYFLDIAETGSLREAARRQKVSVNTIRNHLDRLERARDAKLIGRSNKGALLTEAGQALYELAREMGRVRMAGLDEASENVLRSPGKLTIACTEGLGTSWLTPRISDLRRRVGELSIDLQFDYDLQKDRSGTADIGLTYQAPANPDLIVAKLATVHFMLFASPGYLHEFGEPASVDALADHSFVEQATPGYNATILELLLGADKVRSAVTLQTNSSLTQVWAVANGAGIALLPSYTRAITSLVVPLQVVPQMRFPVYFYYHQSAKGSPAIRATIDWLRAAFDTNRYPWFGDAFLHPSDFPAVDRAAQGVVTLYEHMADRIAVIG